MTPPGRRAGHPAAVLVAVVSLAAAVTLAACGSDSTSDNAATTRGDLTVEGSWVYEPPTPDVTAAFATIRNAGSDDLTLVRASSPIAGMVQVHETVKKGNVETMQEVAGGLTVPSGGSVELTPGGYHVMLMQLKQVPKPGDSVEVTFTFSDGTDITVRAPVRTRAGMSAGGSMSPSTG